MSNNTSIYIHDMTSTILSQSDFIFIPLDHTSDNSISPDYLKEQITKGQTSLTLKQDINEYNSLNKQPTLDQSYDNIGLFITDIGYVFFKSNLQTKSSQAHNEQLIRRNKTSTQYQFNVGDQVYHKEHPLIIGVIVSLTTCGQVNGEGEDSNDPWYQILWNDTNSWVGQESEGVLVKNNLYTNLNFNISPCAMASRK